MATNTSYHPGGYLAAAAQQNRHEQWTNATQPSDRTPAGYTAWDASGAVTTQRALTATEVAQLAAQDATQTASTNQSTIQAALDLRLTQIETFIANNPNGAVLTPAQTLVVAKMLAQLTRLIRNNVGSIGQAG